MLKQFQTDGLFTIVAKLFFTCTNEVKQGSPKLGHTTLYKIIKIFRSIYEPAWIWKRNGLFNVNCQMFKPKKNNFYFVSM